MCVSVMCVSVMCVRSELTLAYYLNQFVQMHLIYPANTQA